MIKLENVDIFGWEAAIRGMRNPMNSWDKSDSDCLVHMFQNYSNDDPMAEAYTRYLDEFGLNLKIGNNDLDLMKRLVKAGTDHRKFMRMIVVYADITAPLYWWKEFDTYKVGTVRNSCSTMHKITAKEFTLDDFSCEYLVPANIKLLKQILENLNDARNEYNNWDKNCFRIENDSQIVDRKVIWEQMIQLLPSSYNQRATVMLNYEVLRNMYHSRKNHKLDEWREFCNWIETLPYSELITKGEDNA